MKSTTLVRICVLLVLPLLSTGCGTLVHGSDQKITIQSHPSGAEVIYDGAVRGVTPTAVPIARRPSESVILLRKPGYEDFEIILKNDVSGWALFGNVATLGVGYVVDASTGSFGAYPKDVYTVDLHPIGGRVPLGSTAVIEERH